MNTPVSQIDNAFQDIFDAYAYVKSSIVFEALLAIINNSRYHSYNISI